MRATSLVDAERLTPRDAAGTTRVVRVDPAVTGGREDPRSASCPRHRLVLGTPMVLEYRRGSGGPVAPRLRGGD